MPLDDTHSTGEITYHVGMTYSDFIKEALPMAERHWDEVGSHRDVLKFRPDHLQYMAAYQMGRLTILTARHDGKLIAYLFVVVMPHLRDREKTIMGEDIYYVDPLYRRRMIGPRLRRMAEILATRAGVTLCRRTVKARRYAGRKMPQKLAGGYEVSEIIYDKVLNR